MKKTALIGLILTGLLASCGVQTGNTPEIDETASSQSMRTYTFSQPISLKELSKIVGKNGFISIDYVIGGTYGSYQQRDMQLRDISEASALILEVLHTTDSKNKSLSEAYDKMYRLRDEAFHSSNIETKMIFSITTKSNIDLSLENGMILQSQSQQIRPIWTNSSYENFYKENGLEKSLIQTSANAINAQANLGWQPTGSLTVNGNNLTGTAHRTYAKSTIAWNSTTLATLRGLKSGVYNLDAYEQDYGVFDDSTQYFSSCVSSSDLPVGYSDCVTAGIFESGGSSYTFGSYDNNQFVANRTYTGTTTVFGSAKMTASLNGQLIHSNLVSQAVHCYTQTPFQCGLANFEKNSGFLVRKAVGSSYFNTYKNTPYTY